MDKNEMRPPEIFLRFFRWFCNPSLVNHIEGDLMELYAEKLKISGKKRADFRFIADVLLLFRPGIIRPISKYQHVNNTAMFKSYFKIGWRNLQKNKGYAVINIGGLALGLAVAGIIALWVYDEVSFNQYHENYSRIVQIMKGGSFNGRQAVGQRHLPYPLISELQTTYGENFKHIVPSAGRSDAILTSGEKIISANGTYMGSGAPELFSFQMVHGGVSGLKGQASIMLSRSTAQALFGNDNAMDKDVTIANTEHVKVTGVFEDFPRNSELYGLKFLAPWDLYLTNNPWVKEQDWANHFLHIYAEIQPNTTLENVSANIRDAEFSVIKNLDYMQGEIQYNPVVLLHPMRDWHLYSNFNEGILQNGPAQFVSYMGIIGGFVLLLACINFMNLSTARSEKRAKEVGIRKTMGSFKGQLISQFFSESFLVVFFAFVMAIVLINLCLPAFNDFSGKAIRIPIDNSLFWLLSLSVIVITGLLAGSYPALYLSSFNPVKVLKGTFRVGRFASMPRKALVVLQFSISVMLIICTVIVHNQISFAKDRPVGYNRGGLLMIQKKSDEFYKNIDALTVELKNTGVVTEVSESGGRVTETWSGNGGFTWEGKDPDPEKDHGFSTLAVSHDFGRTVGWTFIDGRDFSKQLASDSAAFVINESAAKYLGFKKPVGQTVHWSNRAYNVDRDFRVIGVIKDMVMDSPFEPVRPAIFFVMGWKGWINLRLEPSVEVGDALPKIEAAFKKVIPSAPFDYKFADQEYATKFVAEERIGKLSTIFSALAILISCLGLFGLASFVAEQRTKELGIRKVLGATVPQLWKLLSKDFVLLVLIACTVAIPVSFYFMKNWLMQYEYRTGLPWYIFAGAATGALLITLLTVSFQAIKAAISNPVSSLRSE
jgi:putative ABC transport system permease protein